MRIQKITTQQPQFKAVNQKYMAWAKKVYSRVENVSGEWLDRLSFDVPVTNMHIPFYFCKDCGKLFYYKDFML